MTTALPNGPHPVCEGHLTPALSPSLRDAEREENDFVGNARTGSAEPGERCANGSPATTGTVSVSYPAAAAGQEAQTEAGGGRPTSAGTFNGTGAAAKTEQRWKITHSAWLKIKDQFPELSISQGADLLGVPVPTLWRIVNEYAPKGFKSDMDNCGSESAWAFVLKDEKFTAKLTEIYLATIGGSGGNVIAGRRTAKMATALTCMAEEPECPEELARKFKAGRFPVCFRRWLKQITPEMEQRARGAKHFQLNGVTSRRDLTVRFPDGSRGDLPAGFKWVFDDMSLNQPFWAAVDGRILFSRQGLYALDHRSLRWLGKMLVLRPREAYRAEDILRFLRLLFQQYGKPDMLVFERGVWHSRKIRGFRITETEAVMEDEFERPEMDPAARNDLADGLAAIGVQVVFANSAHGKIIETCFNHFQDVAAIKLRRFVNIGRHAGEFEAAAKRLRQVRTFTRSAGELGRSPASTGFAPAQEASDLIDQVFAHINGKVNSRGEVPDEVWAAAVGAGEGQQGTRPLPAYQPTDLHVFLPEKREQIIRAGKVTVQVNGEPHDFRAAWMVQLGHGYKVYLRFDPAEPTLGAAIYNREAGSNNRRLEDPARGYRQGELIGYASWEMPAPSLDVTHARGVEAQPIEQFYGAGVVDQGDTIRKRQEKLVATFYSAMPRPGLPAVKSREARDGAGRVVRVEDESPSTKHQAPIANRQRPIAPPLQAPARNVLNRALTPDQRRLQSEDFSRQAQLANQLRALAGA